MANTNFNKRHLDNIIREGKITPSIGEISYSAKDMKTTIWNGSSWMEPLDNYNYTASTTMHDNNITYTTTSGSTVHISDLQWGTEPYGKVLEDYFPDMTELDEMRELYPTLDNAWEKFKSVYRLTIDDYKDKKEDE